MTEVDIWLLGGLCLALIAVRGQKRPTGWLLAIAAAYVASTLYWRSGAPYGAFVGGMCDMLISLAAYLWGKERWETKWVRWLFLFSATINLYHLAGLYGITPASLPHNAYAAMLEAVNWLALAFIGGVGLLQPVGGSNASATPGGFRGSLRAIAVALHRPRAEPPFTHKAAH